MKTPVASLRVQSSYGKRNLICNRTAQIPIWGIWEWAIRRYGILVLPKVESATLRDKSSTDKELDKLYQVPQREAWTVALRWR